MSFTTHIAQSATSRPSKNLAWFFASSLLAVLAVCTSAQGQGAVVNNPPTISGFDGAIEFVEDSAPILVDGNARLFDSDSADFDGGTLYAKLTRYANREDVLDIRTQQIGLNQIAFDGEKVRYNDVIIGTMQRSSTFEFTVTFNANATASKVQGVIRSLTYVNSSQLINAASTRVMINVSDGDGGVNNGYSANYYKDVFRQPVNDVPYLENFDGEVLYRAGGPAVSIDQDVLVRDPDAPTMSGGWLKVEITKNVQATDRLRVVEVSMEQTGGFGSSPLVINMVGFNVSRSSPPKLSNVIRSIEFYCKTDQPSTLPRTITVTINDGKGGQSLPYSKQISVSR